MRDEPIARLRCRNARSSDTTKGVSSSRQQDGGHGSRISAKECVTTHLPNELALKMDGAQACYPYPAVRRQARYARTSRQAWGSVTKPGRRRRVERPLVQILVAVADIQMRTLKTEVENGSM